MKLGTQEEYLSRWFQATDIREITYEPYTGWKNEPKCVNCLDGRFTIYQEHIWNDLWHYSRSKADQNFEKFSISNEQMKIRGNKCHVQIQMNCTKSISVKILGRFLWECLDKNWIQSDMIQLLLFVSMRVKKDTLSNWTEFRFSTMEPGYVQLFKAWYSGKIWLIDIQMVLVWSVMNKRSKWMRESKEQNEELINS